MNIRAEQIASRVRDDGMQQAVRGCFGVLDLVAAERDRLSQDAKLSPVGRREALVEFVTKKAARNLAELTKPARQRRNQLVGSRAECVPEPIDRTDPVAEMRRAEMRTFLRSLPDGQRIGMALQPEYAEAVVDAPAAMSGLHPHLFDQVASAYRDQQIKKRFGDRLERIEAIEDDIAGVDAAFTVATHEMQQSCGMPQHTFQEMIASVVAAVDKPGS